MLVEECRCVRSAKTPVSESAGTFIKNVTSTNQRFLIRYRILPAFIYSLEVYDIMPHFFYPRPAFSRGLSEHFDRSLSFSHYSWLYNEEILPIDMCHVLIIR